MDRKECGYVSCVKPHYLVLVFNFANFGGFRA